MTNQHERPLCQHEVGREYHNKPFGAYPSMIYFCENHTYNNDKYCPDHGGDTIQDEERNTNDQTTH